MSIRKAKPFSQLERISQATGQAIRFAASTGRENCQSSSRTMSAEPAPITLRSAISRVRRWIVKATIANRPRQDRMIATAANRLSRVVLARSRS